MLERRERGAVQQMLDAGARDVGQIDNPVYDINNALIFMRGYQYARFGHLMETHGDRLDRTAKMSLTANPELTYESLAKSMKARTDIFHEVERQFDGADIYITPTITTPSLAADQKQDEPLIVDGGNHGALREAWYPYTVPQNASGHPAMSVPVRWLSFSITQWLRFSR